MKLYGLKTCDTCRKAMKALQGAGLDPVYVDVRADGIAATDLARFYQAFGSDLLNTRSTTWRELEEAERGRDPLDLLGAHPTLMKRPVIERDGALTLGWTKAVQEKYLSFS